MCTLLFDLSLTSYRSLVSASCCRLLPRAQMLIVDSIPRGKGLPDTQIVDHVLDRVHSYWMLAQLRGSTVFRTTIFEVGLHAAGRPHIHSGWDTPRASQRIGFHNVHHVKTTTLDHTDTIKVHAKAHVGILVRVEGHVTHSPRACCPIAPESGNTRLAIALNKSGQSR